jgi:hypothetical protein
MQQIIRIEANNIQWHVGQDTRSNRYVAVCPSLGLTMEGSSNRELMENISDSLHLLINNMFKEGGLDRFLKDRGWTARLQDIKDESEVFFDVPIELIAKHVKNNDTTRTAH